MKVFNIREARPNLPRFQSMRELTKNVKAGKLKSLEIVNDLLGQIEDVDPEIRAWEHLDPALARSLAKIVDDKLASGTQTGTLAGVPLGIKDVFNTIDMPTSMGSELWKGFTPGNDARTVYNLRSQDAVILGKTVTAEFAVHYLAADKTKNPHHPGRIPGTSSSGSAAAVAAFMAPAALGTQTAGSIIRPASFCGVMGFKPTFGAIPRTGVLKTTDTLDTIGCFAREVTDLRTLFEVLRVHGRDYPISHEKLRPISEKEMPQPRIGFLDGGANVFKKYPSYSLNAFSGLAEELKRSVTNWREAKINLPSEVNDVHGLHETIYDKTLAYYFKQESQQYDSISPMIQGMIDRGNRIPFSSYQNALETQAEIRGKMTAALADVDVLLTLSTAGEAPELGQTEIPDTCLIWTFLGFPTLSLPLFNGPERLPFGLQLVGKRYDDYKVLLVAEQILDALGLSPS